MAVSLAAKVEHSSAVVGIKDALRMLKSAQADDLRSAYVHARSRFCDEPRTHSTWPWLELLADPAGMALARREVAERLRELIIEGELAARREAQRARAVRAAAASRARRCAKRSSCSPPKAWSSCCPTAARVVALMSRDDIRDSFEVMSGARSAVGRARVPAHRRRRSRRDPRAALRDARLPRAPRPAGLLPAQPRDPRPINAAARNPLLRRPIRGQRAHPDLRFRSNFDRDKWERAVRRARRRWSRRSRRATARGCARSLRVHLLHKRDAVLELMHAASQAPPTASQRGMNASRSRRSRPLPPSSGGDAERSRTGARLRARGRRRGAVRRGIARPLRDRCVDLPDRAGRRASCRATRRRRARRSRSPRTRACRCCRAAPAPRQCGQTVGAALVIDDSKYLNNVARSSTPRRARVTVEPGIVLDHLNAWLKAARPLVSGRRVDRARRRRSAAWPATTRAARARSPTATWCTTCSAIDAVARRRQPRRASAADATLGAAASRAHRAMVVRAHRRRASATRSTRAVPKVLRRVGGYNLDIFDPQSERPYTDDGASTSRTCWSAAKARSRSRAACTLKLAPLPRAQDARRRQLPDASTRRWTRRSTSSSCGPTRGRAGRPHDDRPGARQSGVPPGDRRGAASGRARRDPAGRVRRRRARAAQRAGCSAARRADGRPRAARQRRRDDRRGGAEGAVGSAQGRPQHHDEHEGRRQAGVASSRTARCRSSTSPSTPPR